jgi:glycosyltransferase involved in cell wall biosynthesis
VEVVAGVERAPSEDARARARAVIAAPLFNKAEWLEQALDSLLAQTYRDFLLVLVDDRSTDDTPAVATRYAEQDERVAYACNPERLGLLDNWRRGFELARELAPSMQYFAWGSDHDLWEPDWLRSLVAILDDHPDAVAAYPKSVSISETGEVIKRPFEFDTAGFTSRATRMRRVFRWMLAGSMVYSLFRADALERAGVYRHVLGPDRLLLTELALQGEFRQVPEVLWKRRFKGLHTHKRQRASSFPGGAPLYTYLPVGLQHIGAFFAAYVIRGEGGPELGRLAGLGATARLLVITFRTWLRRTVHRMRRTSRRLIGPRPIQKLRKKVQRKRRRAYSERKKAKQEKRKAPEKLRS